MAQDGAKNLLDGVLRSSIEVNSDLVGGTLIRIEKGDVSCYNAFKAALQAMIPFGKSGLLFIDNRQIMGNFRVIIELVYADLSRKNPIIFEGNYNSYVLKKWFEDPQNRDQDICILGTQNRYNGIETEMVVHVYPKDCPSCGKSDADPVIISRATAMLILSTYQRLSCRCGFELIPFPMANYEDPKDDENSLTNEDHSSLNLQADDRNPLIASTATSIGIESCQNFMTKAIRAIFFFFLGLLVYAVTSLGRLYRRITSRHPIMTKRMKVIFFLLIFLLFWAGLVLSIFCSINRRLIVSNVDICHLWPSGEFLNTNFFSNTFLLHSGHQMLCCSPYCSIIAYSLMSSGTNDCYVTVHVDHPLHCSY